MSATTAAAPEAPEQDTLPVGGDTPEPVGRSGEPPAERDTVPDAPPARPTRRRRSVTSPAVKTADRKPRARSNSRSRVKIGEGMTGLYTMVGVGLSMVPSAPAKGVPNVTTTHAIGQAIVENAAACGQAWEKVAADNPAVKDALEKLLTVTSFGQLVAAHMPIIIAATVATGTVPAGLVGALGGETAAAS